MSGVDPAGSDLVTIWQADEGVVVTTPPEYLLWQGEDVEAVSISLLPLCYISGRLLVAVPESVWSRKVAERVLSKLIKAQCVEVKASSESGEAHPVLTCKLWLGFLPGPAPPPLTSGGLDAATFPFLASSSSVPVWPDLEGLVAAADEFFAFVSAVEEDIAAPEVPEWETRMSRLEEAFVSVNASLQKLLEGQAAPKQAAQRPSALKQPRVSFMPNSASLLTQAVSSDQVPGLQPQIVQAGRAAGVPEDVMLRMGQLAASARKTSLKEPQVPPQARALSESEDDEAEDDGLDPPAASSQAPVEQAVLQLTKLVKSMTAKTGQAKDLESVLDRAEGQGDFTVSSSASRSKAAAYRRLKRALSDSPQLLYKGVEELMEEDFAAARINPAMASVPSSSRGWLENRSRLGMFPATIRMAWAVAGAHDAIKNGRAEECRARLALLLLAIDQTAVDRGSWLLSQEMLLEASPPFSSFAKPKSDLDLHHSRLADPRVVEILMSRLRDIDSYEESRRRLASNQRPPTVPHSEAPDNSTPADGATGRGGRRGPKGGGKNKDNAAPRE